MEPPDPATAAVNTFNKNTTNEHLINNCVNHNNTLIHKEQYSPRQGSLTNSTGSERESDSAYVCDSESPIDNNIHTENDNDVFDWWFHRSKGSHKSRYIYTITYNVQIARTIILYFLFYLFVCFGLFFVGEISELSFL